MKNLLTLIFALTFSLFLSAQDTGNSSGTSSNSGTEYINSGAWMFGGVFSVLGNSSKNVDSGGTADGPKSSSFSLLPQTAYILNRMLAVGLTLGYVNTATKYTTQDSDGNDHELKNTQSQFIIQPQLAYYVHVMSRLYIFATLYVGMGFGNYKDQNLQYNSDTNSYDIITQKGNLSSFQAGIALSFMYFLSTQWAISLAYGNLYYRSAKLSDTDNSDYYFSTVNYGLDLTLATLQIGIIYYLMSKQAK